jgi:hypothetical protein
MGVGAFAPKYEENYIEQRAKARNRNYFGRTLAFAALPFAGKSTLASLAAGRAMSRPRFDDI